MNSGVSASNISHGNVEEASLTKSWYQTSLSDHPISLPVLFTTTIFSTQSHSLTAISTLALRGIDLPPRTPSSAVMTSLHSLSSILSLRASGEKPPKTTEWIAPSLAQASIATVASTIIGM